MRSLFWISFATVSYTYAGYPLIMALLARSSKRKHRRAPWIGGAEKPISIVMAVYNGAALLSSRIDHLTTIDPELVKEVIIVSDGSTDGTAEILQQTKHPKLVSILLPRQSGKAVALNHGVAAAQGEIILFVDIRPHIEPGALTSILTNFADPSVGCVAGELLLRTKLHDATVTAVSGLYWKYEQWIRTNEAAWDSPVGVYGGFYAARSSAVVKIPPGTILDDMFQPLCIIRQGYRSVLDRSAVVADVWPANTRGEFSRKVRTLAGNFQLLQLAPWVLTPANRLLFQLVSHKLLRLIVPYFLLVLLISAAILGLHSPGFATLALLQAVFWLLATVSISTTVPVLDRLGKPASALLMLNAAAVAALYKFVFTRGPLWKIWSPTPAQSLD